MKWILNPLAPSLGVGNERYMMRLLTFEINKIICCPHSQPLSLLSITRNQNEHVSSNNKCYNCHVSPSINFLHLAKINYIRNYSIKPFYNCCKIMKTTKLLTNHWRKMSTSVRIARIALNDKCIFISLKQ